MYTFIKKIVSINATELQKNITNQRFSKGWKVKINFGTIKYKSLYFFTDLYNLDTVASTYLAPIYFAAPPFSRSSSSPTTTVTARPPRIVSFSIYVAVNVLDLLTQF